MYRCPVCGKTYKTYTWYAKHMLSVHDWVDGMCREASYVAGFDEERAREEILSALERALGRTVTITSAPPTVHFSCCGAAGTVSVRVGGGAATVIACINGLMAREEAERKLDEVLSRVDRELAPLLRELTTQAAIERLSEIEERVSRLKSWCREHMAEDRCIIDEKGAAAAIVTSSFVALTNGNTTIIVPTRFLAKVVERIKTTKSE